MEVKPLANMTRPELEALIEAIVTRKLHSLPRDTQPRTWDQARRSIDQHRWTPPAGAKSSLELLREDRDR